MNKEEFVLLQLWSSSNVINKVGIYTKFWQLLTIMLVQSYTNHLFTFDQSLFPDAKPAKYIIQDISATNLTGDAA